MDYLTKSRPNLVAKRTLCKIALLASAAFFLSACDSDTRTTTTNTPPESDADWTIQVPTTPVTVVEGEGSASIELTISRGDTANLPITLTAAGATEADARDLSWSFSDGSIGVDESTSTVDIQLAIGAKPLLPHTRTLQISGDDSASLPVIANLTFNVQPTDKDDVYLIIGQSNAVGASEINSRLSEPGQPDAPNDRIKQLNVTGNDAGNFSTPEDFIDTVSIYNNAQPISPALDPLHEGYNFVTETKDSGTNRIGFGLSFAKEALQNTEARIFLVPAAWSDTGFCNRGGNRLPGLGWNATEKENENLAGTLLHDRAKARADEALRLTGGILRGILWHQGEADSDNEVCANLYAENLAEMVESLRTNISVDARGLSARGAGSDIPFVVGTMSMGADDDSSVVPFNSTKLIVDAAHRNVSNNIPISGVVETDDLVPTGYPCGDSGCIHFGAAAQREMGVRYYQQLLSLLPSD